MRLYSFHPAPYKAVVDFRVHFFRLQDTSRKIKITDKREENFFAIERNLYNLLPVNKETARLILLLIVSLLDLISRTICEIHSWSTLVVREARFFVIYPRQQERSVILFSERSLASLSFSLDLSLLGSAMSSWRRERDVNAPFAIFFFYSPSPFRDLTGGRLLRFGCPWWRWWSTNTYDTHCSISRVYKSRMGGTDMERHRRGWKETRLSKQRLVEFIAGRRWGGSSSLFLSSPLFLTFLSPSLLRFFLPPRTPAVLASPPPVPPPYLDIKAR